MQSIFYILFELICLVSGLVDLPQSHISISEPGYYFQPAQVTEWLHDMFVSSLTECIRQCNQDYLCRTFDYNVEPNWCRLFEVEPSPGQIIQDLSAKSQVGYVQLFSDLYSTFNQTCDYCVRERYLTCIDNRCQCPWNTFWDGFICQKQKYAGSLCTKDIECRTYPYNLTCVSANVCTSTGYPSNICVLNRKIVLFNYTRSLSQSYQLYSFNITAITTSMTVTFSLENLNAFWLLDNISLIEFNTSKQLIQNGDFETGNLIDWNYCNPNSTSNSSKIGRSGSLPPQNGQYFYYGAPYPNPDFLSQAISTTTGNLYIFSFWLQQSTISTNNHFLVTIFV